MKYKNVKFDLFFMVCSLHLLGLLPPKKFKIKQNLQISEAWKLYVERNYFVFPVSQFEQRCYRTKVDVLKWGFPDWNWNGFENSYIEDTSLMKPS